MEKLFNPHDKESMRMAILKHEETFREQVCELHRLYQIQKLLMKNIASSRKQGLDSADQIRCFKNIAPKLVPTNHHKDIHQRPPRRLDDLQLPSVTQANSIVQVDDETELELTLGLGPTSKRTSRQTCSRKQTLDLETSIYSDSAASFNSSCSTDESATILRRSTIRSGELIGWQWGLDHLHSSNSGGVVGARKNGSGIKEEQFRQDRHRNPPWLLQALSLNTN